jgi:hypothetical protein
MELDWYCTRAFGMRQQSCWGVLWFFKRPRVSPMENQRNRQHVIWCLITKTQANRVAIVSSVITKILNPCKPWTVTIQTSVLYVQWICLLEFVASSLLLFIRCSTFISFCSGFTVAFVQLFSVRLFIYSMLISLLYFDPHINNNLASQ